MNDREDVTVLICAASQWGAREKILPGTVEGVCADCGQPILIAPSGLRLQAEHDAITVCGPCGEKSILANPGSMLGAPTLDQIAELFALLAKGGADEDDEIVI